MIGGNDGYYSYTYLTNNGGLTWEEVLKVWTSNRRNQVHSVYGFNNSKNIIQFINLIKNSSQTEGLVYVTNDTGENWTRIRLEHYPFSNIGISCTFLLENEIFITSDVYGSGSGLNFFVSQFEGVFFEGIDELERNTIFKTDYYNQSSFQLNDVYYGSSLSFLIGYDGLFSISSDLGKNWTVKTIHGFEDINFTSINFNNNSEGILTTDSGEILISTNNGQSWTLKYDLGNVRINNSLFLNQNKFIVIGENGLIEILGL